MARERGLVLIAGTLALVLAAVFADAQIPAAPGSVPRDEEPGRAREVVPLPPIPEHMAVPSPTEGVEIVPTPEPTAEPIPTAKPRAQKHRKNPTPKPVQGLEKL